MRGWARTPLAVLAPTVLLLLAGAFWLFSYLENRLERATESDLRVIAASKVREIAGWRAGQLAAGRELAESGGFVERLDGAVAGTGPRGDVLSRLRALRSHYDYSAVAVLGPEGRARFGVDDDELNPPIDVRDLRDALAARKPFLTDLRAMAGSQPFIDLLVPIAAGRDAPVSGVVVLRSEAGRSFYTIVEAWPAQTHSAEALVVRRDGDDVEFLSQPRFRADAVVGARFPLSRREMPAVMSALGEKGPIRGRDYRGVDVLAFAAPVPDSPWHVVVKIDAAEALAPLRAELLLIAGLFLCLSVAAVIAASMLWRRAATVRHRELRYAQAAMRESEERYRTTLLSVGDCVVSTDIDGRVQFLNAAAEALTAWPAEDAVGRPLDEVLRVVDERSRVPIESPVTRALREGRMIALADHTLLVARDGTERPIADSAAPIRDAGGTLSGVVLVFRDQSAERAAAQALKESEARYHGVLDAMIEGCQIIGFDWRYLYLNESAAAQARARREDLLGRTMPECFPGIDGSPLFAVLRACMHDRVAQVLENRFAYPDGSAGWFQLNVQPVPEGLFILSLDISERRRVEDALRESEEKYRLIAENVSDVAWILDLEASRFRYVSPSVTLLRGYSVEEVLAQDMASALTPRSREHLERALPARIEAFKKGDETAYTDEIEQPRKDGSTVWTETSTRYVVNAASGHLEVYGVSRDISARKRAEDALRESEERLRLFIEHAPAALAMFDLDMRYIAASRRWVADYGLTADKVLGRTHYKVFPEIPERWKALHRRGLAGEVLSATEDRFERLDGSVQWIRWDLRPWHSADGEVGGIVIFSEDITAHKLAGEALRESEARYRLISENAGDVISIIDPDTMTFEYASPSVFKLRGFTPDQVVGQPIAAALTPESFEQVRALVAELRIVDGSAPFPVQTHELDQVRKDGSTVATEVVTTALLGDDGRVARILSVSRDITQRRAAEEALRASTETVRAIVATSPLAVIVVDLDGNVTLWNRAAESVYGFPAAEVVGGPNPSVPPEYRDSLRERRTSVGAGQSFIDIETERVRRDGRRLTVSVSSTPLRDGRGRLTGLLAIETDITERRQAEAERLRLASAMEQAAETIVITDPAGTIQYVNPAFTTVTGYTREEAIGGNPRLLHSGEHDEAFYRDLWQTIGAGGTWNGRFVNRKKDGTTYSEDATISPLRDPSGAIGGYIATKRDVTNELRLETQLQQAQKMESIGRLAGGVAHDFNNMLQVITSYVEMAIRKAGPDEQLGQYLQQIRQAAERSANLTRQLLAFARRQPVSPQVLDLNETVAGMLGMLRRLIGEDIDLAWMPGRDLWTVRIDPTQVDQVLANLSVNAHDAIAGVGKVTVETGNIAFDQAYCDLHPGFVPGDYVVIGVSDDGKGMDGETLAHLFEPFFTTKAPGKGTGLGLATIYGVVRQNGGFINVYSEQGQGSTFRIYLPRYHPQGEPQRAQEIAPPLRGGSETILLVEDERAILDLARLILEDLGYRVFAARTPDEAIRIAGELQERIDLLVTDVVMPRMNGRELADRIRAARPGLKVLYMSGYTADVIAHRGVLDKGVRFLPKPFAAHDLAQKVRETLDT
jgi:PAS domain S-box-containing protein